MQEVEVKAKVRNKKTLLAALVERGVVLTPPVEQYDRVYLPKDKTIPDLYIYPDYATLASRDIAVMRIRESGGEVLLTMKKPIKNQLDCIEHEVVVSNADEAEAILFACGFHEIIRFHKHRQKGKYGPYEICVDEVTELGSFIEAEKLTDGMDSEAVQEELFGFLAQFGITHEDRVMFGYDTLTLKSKGIIP